MGDGAGGFEDICKAENKLAQLCCDLEFLMRRIVDTARGAPSYSDRNRPRHANASRHGRVLRKQRHPFLSIQLRSR